MADQGSLFEFIDEAEFQAAQAPAKPKGTTRKPRFDLSNRTQTVWFQLPTRLGWCSVPSHDSIQQTLTTEAQAYRQKYPTRMVFAIDPYDVCRDCFLVEADIDCAKEGLAPIEYTDPNS